MDSRGGGQGHWRKAAPPTKQVAWRPWRKTRSGNGPPGRPVGKWTEARTSTGPGKPGGVNAVSPKLYSARVTASGPGVAGSGGSPCAPAGRAVPSSRANGSRTAREIRRRMVIMIRSFGKRQRAFASRVRRLLVQQAFVECAEALRVVVVLAELDNDRIAGGELIPLIQGQDESQLVQAAIVRRAAGGELLIADDQQHELVPDIETSAALHGDFHCLANAGDACDGVGAGSHREKQQAGEPDQRQR